MIPSSQEHLHIFISYSHRDTEHLERLKIHLAPYLDEGELEDWLWDDTQILTGSKWFDDIKQALQRADVAILLISADFLASRFIKKNELPPLLEAAEKKGLKIMPVILSPCGFENHKELSQFQPAHKLSHPLSSMHGNHKREEWWAQVAKNIYNATITQKAMRNQSTPNQIGIHQSTVSDNKSKSAYTSGLQYLSGKSYVEAIDQFKIALSDPSYEVLYSLGRAYQEYGRSVKEKDEQTFIANMRLAAEQFDKSATYRSNSVDAYIQSGLCYEEIASYLQAADRFNQALQLNPQEPAIYYRLGIIATKQRRFRDAEVQFLQGLKTDPANGLILIALGHLYTEINLLPSAISTLRQATQHCPKCWNVWCELGHAYIKDKSWELALNALEQAKIYNQNVSTIYSALALCYRNMGKKTEARQMAIEALQHDPQNIEAGHLLQQL